jgi:hypothetical protein
MIIGMTGKAGSGKDTVADILVHHHGFAKVAFADPIKRICKDVFRFSSKQLWGPSSFRNAPDFRYPRGAKEYQEAYEREKERNAELAFQYARQGWLTPRHALQQLGTEWGRACYAGVWAEYALRVARGLLNERANYSAQKGLWPCPCIHDDRDYYHGSSASGTHPTPKGVVLSDVRFHNEVALIHASHGIIWKTVYEAGSRLEGDAATHESEQHIGALKVDAVVPSGELEGLPGVVAKMLKEVVQ